MGKIYMLLGKSASGKDTIRQLIQKAYPNFKNIVTYTTRPMRAGEKEGESYHFVTDEEFERMDTEGMFFEKRKYLTPAGVWKYATSKQDFDLSSTKYMLVGTLPMLASYKSVFANDVIPIYIERSGANRLLGSMRRISPSNNQEQEMEEICRRFLSDQKDYSPENLKKAGISTQFLNNNPTECACKILEYIAKHTDEHSCSDCAYCGDKYSFPLPNDLPNTDPQNPRLKRYYCCCGDCIHYRTEITGVGEIDCDCFEEL